MTGEYARETREGALHVKRLKGDSRNCENAACRRTARNVVAIAGHVLQTTMKSHRGPAKFCNPCIDEMREAWATADEPYRAWEAKQDA